MSSSWNLWPTVYADHH